MKKFFVFILVIIFSLVIILGFNTNWYKDFSKFKSDSHSSSKYSDKSSVSNLNISSAYKSSSTFSTLNMSSIPSMSTISSMSNMSSSSELVDTCTCDIHSNTYCSHCIKTFSIHRIRAFDDNDKPCLSFSFEMDRVLFNSLSENSNVSIGLFVVPLDHLTKNGFLTDLDSNIDWIKEFDKFDKTELVYKSFIFSKDNDIFLENGNYCAIAHIRNILERNYKRKFFGLSFVRTEYADGSFSYKYASIPSGLDYTTCSYSLVESLEYTFEFHESDPDNSPYNNGTYEHLKSFYNNII